MSRSIKPLIHGEVTQKQLELVPLMREPQQRSLSQSTQCLSSSSVLFSGSPFLLLFHLTGVTHLHLFVIQRVSSSLLLLCLPVSLPLAGTIFMTFIIPKTGSSQPGLLSQALTQSSLCISVSLSTACRFHFHFHMKYSVKNTLQKYLQIVVTEVRLGSMRKSV